jgi:hypothetical protein
MSTSAQFASDPKNGVGQVSVANTARDGTGTLATVWTVGANGGKGDEFLIQAVGSTTAGMIRLFLDIGGTVRLIGEVPVVLTTPTSTQPAWSAKWKPNLALQAGAVIKASTHNAETFNVIPTNCGDY